MFGYREDNSEYWGKLSIKVMIWVASVLMIFTQLYITVWFLTFHDWWWFFSLGFALPANIALPYSIITKKPLILKFLLVYQLLYTCLFLSSVIDLIIRLAHPNRGYFFNHCYFNSHLPFDKCSHRIRVLTGVYMVVYLLFAFINFFCLTVIWNYYKFITGESPLNFSRSSTTPASRSTNPRNPPTPVYPRDNPAPPAAPKPSSNSGPGSGATMTPPAVVNSPSGATTAGIFSTTASSTLSPYNPYNPPPPAGTTSYNSSASYNTYSSSQPPQYVSSTMSYGYEQEKGGQQSTTYNNSSSTQNYGQAGYTTQEVSPVPPGINPNWGGSPNYQPPAQSPYSPASVSTPGPPPPPRPTFGTLYDETPGEY